MSEVNEADLIKYLEDSDLISEINRLHEVRGRMKAEVDTVSNKIMQLTNQLLNSMRAEYTKKR